jgi:hypothetical protein
MPNISDRIKSTTKTKKRNLAIPAVATEMPVNPKIAAKIDMIKNTSAQ